MDLRGFDLNLLRVLDALLKERTVTAAASRLGLSQPTVSQALSKLRDALNDPLFIKNARGMEPTPRARALMQPLDEVMASIRDTILAQPTFDPATTDRRFVLLSGEIGQMIFAHHLFARVREAAPRASICVISALAPERTAVLEDGRADLAIGHFPQFLQSNFFQQLLYARPLVCVARAEHPALRNGHITLEAFLELDHAILGKESNLQHSLEAELRKRSLKRHAVIELANVSAAPYLLSASDAVAVMPESLARIFSRTAPLAIAPVPLPLPMYEVKQFWHRKVNHDPAVTWLRNLVRGEFQQQ